MAAFLIVGISWQFLIGHRTQQTHPTEKVESAATFVGSQVCSGCHQAEAERWSLSQHKLAMNHATDKSVLGDFDDASFDYYGVHSRFYRKDGKFLVETDGSDGKFTTFEIKYTFGVDPLQQYLIEFSDGRLQALSIAWDSRPKHEGGQRWFHLYPDEQIRHDDILHWTKLNQNWNFMCAECHSTGVRKNYDAAKDRFATSWAEIHVGCEACHGAGSHHVAWAQNSGSSSQRNNDLVKGLVVQFDERRDINWSPNKRSGLPQRSTAPVLLRKEVETCGLCHARRAAFSEDWVPGSWLSHTHRVSPLDRQLFHADGQMRDFEETYTYGPFKQSKMFAKGVTCSDCHDPHSASLRAPGNGVCIQCHAPEKYDTAAHSHHDGVNPPLTCRSCHMPERTYMVIDKRHDHSFRVPRPDLSAKAGTPNVCTDCHKQKSAQWAAAAVESWFGPKRKGSTTTVEAFQSAWTDQMSAENLLAQIASDGGKPAFLRASAFTELSGRLSQTNIGLARSGLSDPDPMVRISALGLLEGIPVDQLWSLASRLLSDPVRGVRIRAVSLLASVPPAQQPEADHASFEKAAAEYVAAHHLNADRPEARTALGGFYAQRGHLTEAETEFKMAMSKNPKFSPAAINLADLYRLQGRDPEAIELLRKAIKSMPQDASLHHSLGLVLVRLKRAEEALDELHRAVELAPDQSRYAYVYGVGLHSNGRRVDAIAVLKQNLVRHPRDRATLLALISFNHEVGAFSAALDYAKRLTRVEPRNTDLSRFVQELRLKVMNQNKK